MAAPVTYRNVTVRFGEAIKIERGYYSHFCVYLGTLDYVRETVDAQNFQLFLRFGEKKGLSRVDREEHMVLEFNGDYQCLLDFSSSAASDFGCRINSMDRVLENSKLKVSKEYPLRDPDEVMELVIKYLQGKHPPYNLLAWNCEHVTNDIAHGRPISQQSDRVVEVASFTTVAASVAAGAMFLMKAFQSNRD